MKVWIGEYGRIIILAISVCSIILFLGDRGETGFLGLLAKGKLDATFKSEDNIEFLEGNRKREKPILSAKMKKLEQGKEYDLLAEEVFAVKAVSPDGEQLDVQVEALIAPSGTDKIDCIDVKKFIAEEKGVYCIRYLAQEIYQENYKNQVKKGYYFTVD